MIIINWISNTDFLSGKVPVFERLTQISSLVLFICIMAHQLIGQFAENVKSMVYLMLTFDSFVNASL